LIEWVGDMNRRRGVNAEEFSPSQALASGAGVQVASVEDVRGEQEFLEGVSEQTKIGRKSNFQKGLVMLMTRNGFETSTFCSL
jgi:hypothetical protein